MFKAQGLHPRNQATISEKVTILDWHQAHNFNKTAIPQHFQVMFPQLLIKHPLVFLCVKAKYHLCKQSANHQKPMERNQDLQCPEFETLLSKWVGQAILDNMLINGDVICEKGKEFADSSRSQALIGSSSPMDGLVNSRNPQAFNTWTSTVKVQLQTSGQLPTRCLGANSSTLDLLSRTSSTWMKPGFLCVSDLSLVFFLSNLCQISDYSIQYTSP